jgi:signal transduction histidine kinase
MFLKFRQSLRHKIIALFGLTTFIVVAAYGFLTYFSARQELEVELGKRLTGVAQAISTDLSSDYIASQIETLSRDDKHVVGRLTRKLERIRKRLDVRRVFVFDRKMTSLLDTSDDIEIGQKLYGIQSDKYELNKVFDEKKPAAGLLFEGEGGRFYKNGYAPIFKGDEVVAAIGVAGSADYFQLLEDFGFALAGIGVIALFFATFVGSWIGTRLSRPIERLVEAARRFGRGELEEPVDEAPEGPSPHQGDEIQFLAGAMEDMRQKILQRDQRMQMMLSGIAHEIRNPLGGMKLQCGLLAEELNGASEEVAERCERIEHQIHYLEDVVDDFLGFATEKQLEKEYFMATDLLDELRGLIGQQGRGETEIDMEVSDESLQLWGSFSGLKQAVLNLVKNSLAAMDTGGTVAVRVLETDGTDGRQIVVEDTGPGIGDEIRDRVAEPFFTTREQGSGLGLALVKKIVEEHDGDMSISNRASGGARIDIQVPFEPEPDNSTNNRDVPEGWLG